MTLPSVELVCQSEPPNCRNKTGNSLAIFTVIDNCYTVSVLISAHRMQMTEMLDMTTHFGKVRKLVTANFEPANQHCRSSHSSLMQRSLCIVPAGVAMSRSLDYTELRIVCRIVVGDVQGELD